MPAKRKKVTLTIEKKLEALFRLDNGEPMRRVARSYGVGISTVSDWKRNRKEIENFCSKMVSKDNLSYRGTVKRAKNVTLDDALFVWYIQERENGIAVSGPMLKEKALSLNKKLGGDPTFTASVGWLGRWKGRHGIKLNLSSEAFLQDPSSNNKINHHHILIKENFETDKMVLCLAEDEETKNSLDNKYKNDSRNLNHTEAVVMLEKLITYFHHQSDTLENELITLKDLFNRASGKCSVTIKQEKTNDFAE